MAKRRAHYREHTERDTRTTRECFAKHSLVPKGPYLRGTNAKGEPVYSIRRTRRMSQRARSEAVLTEDGHYIAFIPAY